MRYLKMNGLSIGQVTCTYRNLEVEYIVDVIQQSIQILEIAPFAGPDW